MNELFKSTAYGTVTVTVFFKYEGGLYRYFIAVESISPYQRSWSREFFIAENPPTSKQIEFAVMIHHKVFKHVRKKLKKESTRLLQRSHFRKLWMAQEHTCYLCDETMSPQEITVDHVVPLSRGGKDSNRNKLLAHGRCNVLKANRMPTDSEMDKMYEILRKVRQIALHRIH